MATKRLFIAHMIKNIKGISEVRRQLSELKIEGKWVETHNLHFTYRFIGNFEENKIPSLKQILSEHLRTAESPDVVYKGLGIFPDNRNCKVLWIGVNSENLLKVKFTIDTALKSLSIQEDNKPFKPHITILRIKKLRHFVKFKNYIYHMREHIFLKESAKTVSLVESKLTPHGPVYKELLRIDLK